MFSLNAIKDFPLLIGNQEDVRGFEMSLTFLNKADMVAVKLPRDHVPLVGNDPAEPIIQVLNRDLFFAVLLARLKSPLKKAGIVDDRRP